jgi:hypothetical protein
VNQLLALMSDFTALKKNEEDQSFLRRRHNKILLVT